MAMEPVENAYAESAAVETISGTPEASPAEMNVPALLKQKAEACKRVKRNLVPEWTKNIDYRRAKPNQDDSDGVRNIQTVDWAFTKSKITQLHSKTPQVTVEYEGSGKSPFKIVTPVLQRRLNRRIRDAKVAIAMDEMLPDLVNASGVCAALVSFEAREETRQVPQFDETKLTMMQQVQKKLGLFQNPMTDMTVITDRKFACRRVSPVDLIWDTASPTSDFDEHALIGHTDRIPEAEARRRWPDLTDDDIKNAKGDDRTDVERLVSGEQDRKYDDYVVYDEIFYYRYKYHPEEPSFKAIQHVVFLKSRNEPVVNEPWAGQKVLDNGTYIGACKLPIRVATLTYISDEPIPPSDSAMGRPMVDELMEYHQDQREQRKHSIPFRWADTNRIAPETLQQMMEGNFQGIVFVQGDGSRAVGEVARASYPREDNIHEQSVRQALQESWKVGPNQLGTMAKSGEHSATEADIAQSNYSSEVGYERSKTVNLFLGIADVLFGLMLMYDDFDVMSDLSDQDKQRLQGVDIKTINHESTLTIRPDSTVFLDSNQEFQRLDRFLDKTAKSGFVNPKPIIERMAALSQIDPMEVVVDPQPKSPEQPNISFRFSGDDLLGPMSSIILAIMAKNGQAPTPDELEAVFKMRRVAGLADIAQPGVTEGQATPLPNVPDNPHPEWNMMDKLNTRQSERGAQ